LSSLAIGCSCWLSYLTLVGAGLVFIEPTETGVVVTIWEGRYESRTASSGLHWIVPFVERVERYPNHHPDIHDGAHSQ
jgi:regulator of protease activity HflC (stomatin/prohibitin superfamily)